MATRCCILFFFVAVFLPGKFHGQKSLKDYSPWGHRESDIIEHTHTQKRVAELKEVPSLLFLFAQSTYHLIFLQLHIQPIRYPVDFMINIHTDSHHFGNRELCSMLCGSLDEREVWIHVYGWLSTFAVYLKISQHC